MDKIATNKSKILKLINVFTYKCLLQEEDFNFQTAVDQMESYIRTKGAMQIGPLIQYTNVKTDEAGDMDLEVVLMLQCNNYIHSVEPPYSMEAVIRVPDCMYCRYTGPEEKLNFAYDKINLEAFEEDIELETCNYTVFVDSNEEDETIVADVFIPRKKP